MRADPARLLRLAAWRAPPRGADARLTHWGTPHWTDEAGQQRWTAQTREFGKRIWEIVGKRRNPAIVFEHPGEDTIQTPRSSSATTAGWS
jgi:hypothetical protein